MASRILTDEYHNDNRQLHLKYSIFSPILLMLKQTGLPIPKLTKIKFNISTLNANYL